MKYFPPIKVISPTDYVSNVKVLYDGGDDSVSVASLEWEGNPCIAMRWNIARREWDDSEKIKNKKTFHIKGEFNYGKSGTAVHW